MDDKSKDVAMQMAEDARQAEWEAASFTAEVFKGKFRWDMVHPFPAQPAEDRKIGDQYLEKVKVVLEKYVDPYKIDEEGEYPSEALEAMAAIGLFGMKIPKEYGGLGLSITNYARVLGLIGSYCSNTVTYLSAHQSIGVPQPLREFGTEEQKRHLLTGRQPGRARFCRKNRWPGLECVAGKPGQSVYYGPHPGRLPHGTLVGRGRYRHVPSGL